MGNVAKEYADATEEYARLARELLAIRGTAPKDVYVKKFTECEAARDRCEKARYALKTHTTVKRRNAPKPT
jgi:hypothetical protein